MDVIDVPRRPASGARQEAEEWFRANWDPNLTLGEWWALLAESGWGQPTWPLGRGAAGCRAVMPPR